MSAEGLRSTTYPVFGPVEDLVLSLLKDFFAGQEVNVQGELPDFSQPQIMERYTDGLDLPLIVPLTRNRSGVIPYQTPEDRWMRSAMIELNTFAGGIDRDIVNSELQEACRHAFLEAWVNQTDYPGYGVINMVNSSVYARPDNDWATSSHVVQYSRLPQNVSRFEAIYRILVRPSRTYSNRFLSVPSGPQ